MAEPRHVTSINRAVELSLQQPGIARRTHAKVALPGRRKSRLVGPEELPAGVDISTSLLRLHDGDYAPTGAWWLSEPVREAFFTLIPAEHAYIICRGAGLSRKGSRSISAPTQLTERDHEDHDPCCGSDTHSWARFGIRRQQWGRTWQYVLHKSPGSDRQAGDGERIVRHHDADAGWSAGPAVPKPIAPGHVAVSTRGEVDGRLNPANLKRGPAPVPATVPLDQDTAV